MAAGWAQARGSAAAHAIAFPPSLAWPEFEVFIKPIREQKEFSKHQSYISSPWPPRTSSVITGSVGRGDLHGGAGGGHHCPCHPKRLHLPLPPRDGSPGPGTSPHHRMASWDPIPGGPWWHHTWSPCPVFLAGLWVTDPPPPHLALAAPGVRTPLQPIPARAGCQSR